MPTNMEQISTDAAEASTETRLLALEALRAVYATGDDWEPRLSAATMVLVDALLEADVDVLMNATDTLRDTLAFMFEDQGDAREIRGWLRGLMSVTRWGQLRLPSPDTIDVAEDSQASQFLHALALGQPRSSGYLKDRLHTGDSQISRVGRRLLAQGLVIQRRLGREARWELTPRGRQLVRAWEDDANTAPARRERASSSGTIGAPTKTTGGPARAARTADGPSRRARQTPQTATAAVLYRGSRTGATKPKAKRFVAPDPRGGWRVVKEPSGRVIERHATKAEAITRAKEIVQRAGGGVVVPHDRGGAPGKPLAVSPRAARN